MWFVRQETTVPVDQAAQTGETERHIDRGVIDIRFIVPGDKASGNSFPAGIGAKADAEFQKRNEAQLGTAQLNQATDPASGAPAALIHRSFSRTLKASGDYGAEAPADIEATAKAIQRRIASTSVGVGGRQVRANSSAPGHPGCRAYTVVTMWTGRINPAWWPERFRNR